MQWKGRRRSANVEDRRSMRAKPLALGGGVIAVVIVLAVLTLATGGDLTSIFGQLGSPTPPGATAEKQLTAAEYELGEFVSVVLADTEDYWTQEFETSGLKYRPPRLVLFSGATDTASGYATSATGPFYSPPDETVYIDLSFYQDMERKYAAGGDFAQAYVVAHEVGHHVQMLLGTLSSASAQQKRVSKEEAARLSVRLELQADFYAGVWARYEEKQGWLDMGDIDEALNAASAIGDDRLQMQTQGYVVPDSFTHGTSEQRSRWFRLGYTTGDPSQGDTFAPAYNEL